MRRSFRSENYIGLQEVGRREARASCEPWSGKSRSEDNEDCSRIKQAEGKWRKLKAVNKEWRE